MDPAIPFDARPGCDLCSYCPFRETCCPEE